MSAARNVGVRHSKGDRLCFLDDGDLLYLSHVALLVDCLEGDLSVATLATLSCWEGLFLANIGINEARGLPPLE